MVALSLLAAVILAAVHLLAAKPRFLHSLPRSMWLSIAGGVSVAYVFLHLLPELGQRQRAIGEAWSGLWLLAERHVYVLALLGLAVFYGLERLVTSSRHHQRETKREDRPKPGVFWIHIGAFAAYNGLIGYLLLHLENQTMQALTFFAVAMGLHFIVNDAGLEAIHKTAYLHIGRWILAGAVFLGWLLGWQTTIAETAVTPLVAFLSGGVILNVLKEELPAERESRFLPFALGATGYSLLLLTL